MEDKEIITKLKNCKTVDELKTVGKEIGYELTDEEAKAYFDKFTKSGELSDNELSNVSGGGCSKWRNGKAYSGNPNYWLIITLGNRCSMWKLNSENWGIRGTCRTCINAHRLNFLSFFCGVRTYYNDPLNP